MTALNDQEIYEPPTLPYEILELGELGQTLPLGIWTPDGERLTDFTLARFIGDHELILGELEDANRNRPDKYYRIFTQFLPEILLEIGGYPLRDLAALFKLSVSKFLAKMYLADILTILLNIRITGMTPLVPLTGQCPCEEQFEIRDGENTAAHDMSSVEMRVLPNGDYSPMLRVDLDDGIPVGDVRIDVIHLHPYRFGQMLEVMYPETALDLALIGALTDPPLKGQLYRAASPRDIKKILSRIPQIFFGPERKVPMDCPQCGFEWEIPLGYGRGYEYFYLSLLSAPRESEETGSTSEYFNKVAKFLTFGEQAPYSSRQEVLKLTPSDRNWWVKEISETYERQQKELDKSQSQAKRR